MTKKSGGRAILADQSPTNIFTCKAVSYSQYMLDTTFIYTELKLSSQAFATAIAITQPGSMTLSLAKQY